MNAKDGIKILVKISARGENAYTSDALQRFRSEVTKIEKMRFSAIFELTPKKVIFFTFSKQAKIL